MAQQAPPEPKFEKFLKGFYGTLDVSFDETTKGINGLTAYQYSLVNPDNPNSGAVQDAPKGVPQVGILGYLPALSTNTSQIGYRNTHKIGESDEDPNFVQWCRAKGYDTLGCVGPPLPLGSTGRRLVSSRKSLGSSARTILFQI